MPHPFHCPIRYISDTSVHISNSITEACLYIIMDGSAGDRISALPDELLHVILGFLRDATDVTRTAVLSRRWRHVWVHATKSLSFFNDCSKRINCTAPGQFVDWVLAHRGETAMDSLAIRVAMAGATTTPEQVNEWLRYAGRHVLKSLHVQLGARREHGQQPIAVELPAGHCRTASISLDLAHHSLHLPAATATARYEALTELKLWCPSFVEDEVPVGDFVTSCCPSLRRLSIAYPKALSRLVLRSESLQELEIVRAWDLRTLDVAAPHLRSIKLDDCLHSPMNTVLGNNRVVRIDAPRLEEVDMNYNRNSRPPDIEIRGLASVGCLRNLRLDMHGKYCRVTDDHVGSWLLARCPALDHVHLTLHHWEEARRDLLDKAQLFDLTAKETMANFANVKSMVVVASSFPTRHLVASASSLLMCCPRLRSLHLRISDTTQVIFFPRYIFLQEI